MKSERAAIYCRLSQEDREKASPGQESRSISNQRALLLDYAAQQSWTVTEIYIDEDYSGSDRERPAFRKMLRDAQAGKFHILLCKSQSRFTRELELVEKYINGLFVDWGIRFIGVADHVDTDQREGKKVRQLGGLINEWYLEDLSDSIRAVLRSHQKQGRHIGSFAPYGYQKDPEQAGHLIVDEEAAAVVRRIFSLYAEGRGKTAIAGLLNREQVPNPSRYKEQKGSHYRSKYGTENSGLWRYSTVASILSNPLYTGAVVQHRSEKLSYKSKKLRSLPKEDWIIVPNCHEAIISPELWQKVQERQKTQSRPAYGGRVGIFAGKLRCLYCGQTLRRCKAAQGRCYYRCAGAQVHSGCIGGFIPHEELCRLVWADFSTQMEQFYDPTLLNHDEESIRERLKQNEQAMKRLLREQLRGKLQDTWFQELSEELEQERRQLEQQLSAEAEVPLPMELSPELIEAFIHHIAVGKRDKKTGQVPVEITWKF